jgi:quaternary ammonium compound-resistance protein SugE
VGGVDEIRGRLHAPRLRNISLALGAFVFLLGRSLQVLPIGTAYAVSTGVATVGTVLVGRSIRPIARSNSPVRHQAGSAGIAILKIAAA